MSALPYDVANFNLINFANAYNDIFDSEAKDIDIQVKDSDGNITIKTVANRGKFYQQLMEEFYIPADKVVTVGDGGDFATINEALEELSKSYPLYKNSGFNVEIKLLSGFIMTEQVFVKNIDLSYIVITGEDAETTIDASNFVDIPDLTYHETNTPAFSAVNGKLPIIGQLFTMVNGGSEASGIYIESNSEVFVLPDCGIKYAGYCGIIAYNTCNVVANYSIFTNSAGYGAVIYNGSSGHFSHANLSNSGLNGITMYYASRLSALAIDVSNSGSIGINCANGVLVNASYSNASNSGSHGFFIGYGSIGNLYAATAINTGSYSLYAFANGVANAKITNFSTDGDPTYEYVVNDGGIINMVGATGETDTNVTTNAVSSSGIVFA